jgi:hypothetical protein
MILTHELGSQEDEFDEKNGGQKSPATVPLTKQPKNRSANLAFRSLTRNNSILNYPHLLRETDGRKYALK